MQSPEDVYVATLSGTYMPAILMADLCEATQEARRHWRPLRGEVVGVAAVGRGRRTMKGHEVASMVVELNGIGEFSIQGDIGGLVQCRDDRDDLFEIEANHFGKFLFVTYPRGWAIRALGSTWTLAPKSAIGRAATLTSTAGVKRRMQLAPAGHHGSPLAVLGRIGGWLLRARPMPAGPPPDDAREALVFLLISLWFQLAVHDPDPHGSAA